MRAGDNSANLKPWHAYSKLSINIWDSYNAKLCKTTRGGIASRCSCAGAQNNSWNNEIGEIGRFGHRVVVDEDKLRHALEWSATAFLADYRRAKPRNHKISAAAAAICGEPRRGQIWRGPGKISCAVLTDPCSSRRLMFVQVSLRAHRWSRPTILLHASISTVGSIILIPLSWLTDKRDTSGARKAVA